MAVRFPLMEEDRGVTLHPDRDWRVNEPRLALGALLALLALVAAVAAPFTSGWLLIASCGLLATAAPVLGRRHLNL